MVEIADILLFALWELKLKGLVSLKLKTLVATLAVKYTMYFEVHCVLRREVVCARSFYWSQTINKWVGQVGRRWERIQTENIVEG